eukprot:scaffold48082_cov19-Prasinocladus_malaysianus.AAC.1
MKISCKETSNARVYLPEQATAAFCNGPRLNNLASGKLSKQLYHPLNPAERLQIRHIIDLFKRTDALKISFCCSEPCTTIPCVVCIYFNNSRTACNKEHERCTILYLLRQYPPEVMHGSAGAAMIVRHSSTDPITTTKEFLPTFYHRC